MILSYRFLICCLLFEVCYSTVKVYLDELCDNEKLSIGKSVNIRMDSTGQGSAGILRPERIEYYESNKNCVVTIRPPEGYGVVVSIRKIEFLNSIYRDSLTIYSDDGEVEFHKFEYYPDESYSLSTSGPMTLKYETGPRTYDWSATGFELTFTAFNKGKCASDQFSCKNSRCVWNGLKCDDHNNCGDGSDESFDEFGGCWVSYKFLRISLTTSAVIIIVVTVIIITTFCLRRKRQVVTTTTIIEQSPTYGTVPKATSYPANYQIGPALHTVPTNYPVGNVNPQHLQQGYVNPVFPEGPPPPYKP